MQEAFKVSVITVCFNSSATIRQTLASVANQSYLNIEHLVIDGDSLDGTQAIVKEFSHVNYFISEPDHGIYDAMNKGLHAATGDIIAFLNADDQYFCVNTISRIVEQFRQEPIDALLGDVVFFNPNTPDKLTRRYRSDRFSPTKLAWGWMPAHPGLFFHKRVIERTGLFRTDYKIAGDYEYVVRAFTQGKLDYKHFPEVLVKMSTGGVSTQGLRATLRLNREVIRACRDNQLKTNWFMILSKYPLKALEFFRK